MKDLLLCLLLKMCQSVLTVLDLMLEPILHISLTLGSRKEREEAKLYDRYAHKVTVWARATTVVPWVKDLRNFLHTHHSYLSPSYILTNDNVTLLSITSQFAIFSESSPQVRATDSKVSPFYWEGTYVHAEYLLLLPIKHLHTLAKEAGDPTYGDRRVSLIHMTTRCGSTILGQVLEALPGTRLLSEPMVMGYVCSMYQKGMISFAETTQLIDSVFCLLCKRAKKIHHVVLKLAPLNSPAIPIIKLSYPKIDIIFNARHVRPTIRSWVKLEQKFITLSFIVSTLWALATAPKEHSFVYGLPSFSDLLWWQRMREEVRTISLTDPQSKQRALTIVYAHLVPIVTFLHHRYMYTAVILYEDLAEDPKSVVIKLLESLSLPMDHLTLALTVLDRDSQGDMFGPRGQKTIPEEVHMLKAVDDLLKKYEAPYSTETSLEDWKKLFSS